MPWLSRQNSAESTMMNPMKPHSPMSLPSDCSVTFIPSMMDGSCGTSPAVQKLSAMEMLLGDMNVMAQNRTYIPGMMMGSIMNMGLTDMCLQIILSVMEMWMLCVAIPCFLAMPGMAFMCGCCISACGVMAMCWPMSGPSVLRGAGKSMEHADERWVYINGAMTSHNQMRSQLTLMSNIFGRPITGIHNPTMGMCLDMICMMLQNVIPMMNRSTSTVMYTHLRECLLNASVRKVVVMSQGTGCSIMSMAIDRLHADLPIDVLGKMEIYTFGSAASHLSNPCLTLNSPMNPNPSFTRADGSLVSPVKATMAIKGQRIEDTERVIPHIEHYAMSSDFFARCGIMHHTRSMLDNTMCGREFIINPKSLNMKTSAMPALRSGGCMMNHYMEMLFPSSNSKSGMCMLDEKVAVDMQIVEKREFTAQSVSMQLKPMGLRRRSPSGNVLSSPPNEVSTPMSKAEKRPSAGANQMIMGSECVEAARRSAKECEGRTVRQLSRLWMYAGGHRPVGEGVGTVNGIGLGLNGMM